MMKYIVRLIGVALVVYIGIVSYPRIVEVNRYNKELELVYHKSTTANQVEYRNLQFNYIKSEQVEAGDEYSNNYALFFNVVNLSDEPIDINAENFLKTYVEVGDFYTVTFFYFLDGTTTIYSGEQKEFIIETHLPRAWDKYIDENTVLHFSKATVYFASLVSKETMLKPGTMDVNALDIEVSMSKEPILHYVEPNINESATQIGN